MADHTVPRRFGEGRRISYTRGPMTGRVIDMTYSVADELYKAPPPTWVAAPLVEWTLVK